MSTGSAAPPPRRKVRFRNRHVSRGRANRIWIGRAARPAARPPPRHGMPYEVHPAQRQSVQQPRHIGAHQFERVLPRSVASPVATQVRRIHLPVFGEDGRDVFPVGCALAQRVQQDHRQRGRRAPGPVGNLDPVRTDHLVGGHGSQSKRPPRCGVAGSQRAKGGTLACEPDQPAGQASAVRITRICAADTGPRKNGDVARSGGDARATGWRADRIARERKHVPGALRSGIAGWRSSQRCLDQIRGNDGPGSTEAGG